MSSLTADISILVSRWLVGRSLCWRLWTATASVFSKLYYADCIFAQSTWLTHLLSVVRLLDALVANKGIKDACSTSDNFNGCSCDLVVV